VLLLPLLDLGYVAAGIFEHELVGVHFQDTGKIVAVAAFATTPSVARLKKQVFGV